MKKGNFISGVAVAFTLFLTGVNFCLAEQEGYIDNSVYSKPTQNKVKFVHDDHNDMAGIDECSVCHHFYEDGVLIESESSEDTPCSDCHSTRMFNKEITLTTAFHNCCKGCHMKEKKGPVMCGECHQKQ